MVTIDSGIVFDFPQDWERFSEGSRCVFHTPSREEIILSATKLTSEGPANEKAQWLERVFQNGVDAAKRSASSPELRVVKPLAVDKDACKLRCWTVLAETPAKNEFYGQAIIQHQQGVVYLTYEAPFIDGAETAFYNLLRRIHAS